MTGPPPSSAAERRPRDATPGTVTGYAEQLSLRPGDELDLKMSTPYGRCSVEIVRLHGVQPETNGDASQKGSVLRQPMNPPVVAHFEGAPQPLTTGSWADLPVERAAQDDQGAVIFDIWFRPSLLEGRQVIAAGHHDDPAQDWRVLLEGDELTLSVGPAARPVNSVTAGSVVAHAWAQLACSWDAEAGVACLALRAFSTPGESAQQRDVVGLTCAGARPWRPTRLTLAANLVPDPGSVGPPEGSKERPPPASRDHFWGRLAKPRLSPVPGSGADAPVRIDFDAVAAAQPLVTWCLGQHEVTDVVAATGLLAREGRLHQGPTRLVTGPHWRDDGTDPSGAPELWDAVAFHGDDLADAQWRTSVLLPIPPGTPSGIYAAHVEHPFGSDDVPFYVRAENGAETEILFVAPTNTYLAYANEHLAHGERGPAHEVMMARPITLNATDHVLGARPELGLSLYDVHRDGSGVVHSSRRRPVLNMRPDYETWLTAGRRHFAADFFITGWLEHAAEGFDVCTDEDVHREGHELLDRYAVVVTGSHPEYVSQRQYDAVEAYLDGGGHLMYLGANGFFWVSEPTDSTHAVIECRRGFAAQRNWTSHPAEIHLASTGTLGGAWQHRGRNLRQLLGVEMCAAGWGPASGYRRRKESRSAAYADLFDGLADDVVGDHGLVLGGAAGDELDSADYGRGTPSHAVVLMSSRHGPKYLPTLETVQSIEPAVDGAVNPAVRADVVLLENDRGGAFSVGSICWAGAMAYNGYDNDVARMTSRVLDRFLRRGATGARHGL